MSLQTHGHCGNCWEFNSYDRTHCHHCNEVLPWGFLIDATLDEPEERPSLWARSMGRQDEPKAKHMVRCLYCEGDIPYDAKVCFHCRTLLASGSKWGHTWRVPLLDSDAPQLRQLIDVYIARRQPE